MTAKTDTRALIKLGVAYPLETLFVMRPKISGVYVIQNVFSDKCYVGATKDVAQRWRDHYHGLSRNWHANKYLLADFRDHPELFVFRLLEACPVSELMNRELYHAATHDVHSKDWGYNPQPHKYPIRKSAGV